VAPVPPAQATTSFTVWKCALAGCKYAQARWQYDGTTNQVNSWKGATPPVTCDPTNDITRWLMTLITVNEGNSLYTLLDSYGPHLWKTNCAITGFSMGVWMTETCTSGRCKGTTTFLHDASCSGCDFTSSISAYYP